jgi:hypothetical protein
MAAMRLVKNGLVPPASTVSFIMLIHSYTGSGGAAADGLAVAAMPMSNSMQTAGIRENLFMRVPPFRGRTTFGWETEESMDCGWTVSRLLPDR